MKRKILVIEDDDDACTILEKILVEVGFEVQTLSEGKGILEFKFEVPDLFILDNKLPSVEGIAISKFLRLQPGTRKTPIIVISGFKNVTERVKSAGANHFLAKPFSKEQLLRIVNSYLPIEFFATDEVVPSGRSD